MIVARISMSFDRGVERNRPEDVGLPVEPAETPTGGKICGLGTHFTSQEAEAFAKVCQIEEGRVNRLISREFVRSPIPGLYVLPDRNAGRRFLEKIEPLAAVNARCVVYDLTPGESLPQAELDEWKKRIQAQFTTAPLGRGQGAAQEGLEIIERLAACPLLDRTTRDKVLSLVAQAKIEQIDRVEFRRQIAELDVQIDTSQTGSISPARAMPQLDLEPSVS